MVVCYIPRLGFLPQRNVFRCFATFHCMPHAPTLIRQTNLKHCVSASTNSSSGFFTQKRKRWQELSHQLFKLWKPLPISVGLVLLAVLQWRHVRRREQSSQENNVVIAKEWEITCYRAFPLRALSRVWGWLTNIELPTSLRPWLYSYYAAMFGCNLEEAAHQNLADYKSLADFFCRPLREGVRPVDKTDCIVSPADGCIISFGPVSTCKVEQVKGVTYSLQAFLGPPTWKDKSDSKDIGPSCACAATANVSACEYQQSLLKNGKNRLYQCAVYLAPGDYHRFHSPVDWNIAFRRHFPGDLLSVSPSIAQWIPGLFSLNERVVYVGHWKHGFFSLTAVGATNVGSIRVYCDKTLTTNERKRWRKPMCKDVFLSETEGEKICVAKGDLFGEFRLGSTVVLVFEAPEDFHFRLEPGQRVKVGAGVSNERMND